MRLGYIKDIAGSNYLGVNVYRDTVNAFMDDLRYYTEDQFDAYVSNQQNRDRGHYHITVMSVMEFNSVSNSIGIGNFVEDLESIFNYDFDDVKLMGLGCAERSTNKAYFIVVQSEKLQLFREKYNLPRKDFHITVGFLHKDVHGVPKNQVLPPINLFKNILSNKYFINNETFDFIKDIDNYDGDENATIEPIKLLDSYIVLRISNNSYISVSLVDNQLYITAKWQDTNKLPIISNTLLSKKLKTK